MPPVPLPWPYLPDGQSAGSFEDRTQQNFDALAIAAGSAATGLLRTPTGNAWKIDFGFQAFTFTLTPGSFSSVTVNHSMGVVPAAFFPFITMQDATTSVPYGTFVQGSLTTTQFQVGIANPYSFNLTNAQVGWAIIHD